MGFSCATENACHHARVGRSSSNQCDLPQCILASERIDAGWLRPWRATGVLAKTALLLGGGAAMLSGCADPQWVVDRATPPKAWTTDPITRHFGTIHAVYELHPGGTVTATITPASFPLLFYSETGRSVDQGGGYGNWVIDITFHGVKERYWGHYAYDPDWRALLTVVPAGYRPIKANEPGAGGVMYPKRTYPRSSQPRKKTP